MGTLLRAGAVASAVLLELPLAFAQNTAALEESLFQEGRKALADDNYELARSRFRQSIEVKVTPGAQLNLAVCEEKLGRLALAWRLYKAAQSAVPPEDPRYDYARKQREALESTAQEHGLCWVTIALDGTAPKDAAVELDGESLAPELLSGQVLLKPGKHTLATRASGHSDASLEVNLESCADAGYTVAPGPALPAPAPTPTEPPGKGTPARESPQALSGQGAQVAPPPSDPGAERQTWMLVSGGVGLAGLAAGVSTGLLALSAQRTAEEHCWETPTAGCDQTGTDANSRGKILAVVSPIGFGIAALGLGAAAYLGLSGNESLIGGTRLEVLAGPRVARLALTRDW